MKAVLTEHGGQLSNQATVIIGKMTVHVHIFLLITLPSCHKYFFPSTKGWGLRENQAHQGCMVRRGSNCSAPALGKGPQG